jgi:hypothetical protein
LVLILKFPWINNAKIKEWIFISSQRQKVMNDKNSDEILGELRRYVWEAWKHSD